MSDRKVNPYHLVFRDGQFYLIGYSHERDEVRVFRLSRIRGKVSYATKAEHDFQAPEDFDRRDYGTRADWQMGEIAGSATIFLRERIAWLVERDFGRHGRFRKPTKADGVKRPRLDLRDRLRLASAADLLGAELARERPPARPARARRGRRASASTCCATATVASSRSPRRCAAPSPRATARGCAAPTAGPSP